MGKLQRQDGLQDQGSGVDGGEHGTRNVLPGIQSLYSCLKTERTVRLV